MCCLEVANWIPNSINADGTPFENGVGYKANTRLSLSSGGESLNATGYECTGFIPAKYGDVVRVKNVDLTNENSTNMVFYDSSKTPITCSETRKGLPLALFFTTTEGNGVYKRTISGTIGTWTAPANTEFIRIGSKEITANSVITINEELV